MALKTIVKVGSLTNLSDARYCAGMGVELIGFQVIPGAPAYVSTERFQEIRGWISGPSIVAELQGVEDPAIIAEIMDAYKPDYFELGIRDLDVVGKLPLPFILILGAGDKLPSTVVPKYILVEREAIIPEGMSALVNVSSEEEALEAINQPYVVGIAMIGSSEIRPGLKSYDAMASILEALELE